MHSTDKPEQFDRLEPHEQEILTRWIRENFEESRRFSRYSSYGFKHMFERMKGGFYVCNGAFKKAMLVCGFKCKDEDEQNWVFNAELTKNKRTCKCGGNPRMKRDRHYGYAWYAVCPECGTRGFLSQKKVHAILYWNMRMALPVGAERATEELQNILL